jgi:hypothetical protein
MMNLLNTINKKVVIIQIISQLVKVIKNHL